MSDFCPAVQAMGRGLQAAGSRSFATGYGLLAIHLA
jgi:hypothetical protein